MNLETLFLQINVNTHNCANQRVVVYQYVRQSRLFFGSGMNAFVVLFLAQSLSLPIPQMRCINAQLPELARFPSWPHPLIGGSLPVVKPLSIYSLATRVQAHLALSLTLDKLNWIMSAPLADINFLLLAKLGLPQPEPEGQGAAT